MIQPCADQTLGLVLRNSVGRASSSESNLRSFLIPHPDLDPEIRALSLCSLFSSQCVRSDWPSPKQPLSPQSSVRSSGSRGETHGLAFCTLCYR